MTSSIKSEYQISENPMEVTVPKLETFDHTLTLLNGTQKIKVVCLSKYSTKTFPTQNNDVLKFLHRVRPEVSKPVQDYDHGDDAFFYYEKLHLFLKAYKRWSNAQTFDLVMRPPSRRTDADPYLAAIKMHQRKDRTHDITTCFSRNKDAVVAGAAKDLKEADKSLVLSCGNLKGFQNVLIVDDVLARGFTVCTMITRMREQGLEVNASITVAVPLWIEQVGD